MYPLYVGMCVQQFSCVQLFVTPRTAAYQAPLSVGFSREEYWSGLPFPPPGNLPNPGIKPASPTLAGRFFTTEPPGKAKPPQPPIQTFVKQTFTNNQAQNISCNWLHGFHKVPALVLSGVPTTTWHVVGGRTNNISETQFYYLHGSSITQPESSYSYIWRQEELRTKCLALVFTGLC